MAVLSLDAITFLMHVLVLKVKVKILVSFFNKILAKYINYINVFLFKFVIKF